MTIIRGEHSSGFARVYHFLSRKYCLFSTEDKVPSPPHFVLGFVGGCHHHLLLPGFHVLDGNTNIIFHSDGKHEEERGNLYGSKLFP